MIVTKENSNNLVICNITTDCYEDCVDCPHSKPHKVVESYEYDYDNIGLCYTLCKGCYTCIPYISKSEKSEFQLF